MRPEKKNNNITLVLSIVGALCLVGGSLFKVMHWPFAGDMLIGGSIFISAALIYYGYTKIWSGNQNEKEDTLDEIE